MLRRAKRKNRLFSGLLFVLTIVTICAAVFVYIDDPFNWRRSGKEMEIVDFAKKKRNKYIRLS